MQRSVCSIDGLGRGSLGICILRLDSLTNFCVATCFRAREITKQVLVFDCVEIPLELNSIMVWRVLRWPQSCGSDSARMSYVSVLVLHCIESTSEVVL